MTTLLPIPGKNVLGIGEQLTAKVVSSWSGSVQVGGSHDATLPSKPGNVSTETGSGQVIVGRVLGGGLPK